MDEKVVADFAQATTVQDQWMLAVFKAARGADTATAGTSPFVPIYLSPFFRVHLFRMVLVGFLTELDGGPDAPCVLI